MLCHPLKVFAPLPKDHFWLLRPTFKNNSTINIVKTAVSFIYWSIDEYFLVSCLGAQIGQEEWGNQNFPFHFGLTRHHFFQFHRQIAWLPGLENYISEQTVRFHGGTVLFFYCLKNIIFFFLSDEEVRTENYMTAVFSQVGKSLVCGSRFKREPSTSFRGEISMKTGWCSILNHLVSLARCLAQSRHANVCQIKISVLKISMNWKYKNSHLNIKFS